MIRHLTADQLGTIAFRGAGIEIDATQFTADQLGTIAYRANGKARVKIHNCSCLTADQMGTIGYRGGGSVVFC